MGLNRVAPHVGAWIEIKMENTTRRKANVAPHVGAWIEIYLLETEGLDNGSLLM